MSQTYTFDVGGNPRLEVRVQSGRIDVETAHDGQVSLTLSGRFGDDEIDVDQIGDTVSLRQASPALFGRGGSVRVHAIVPEGTDVELSGASSDMWLYGHLGSTVIRTASGDLSAEVLGRLEAKTASGDIRVERVEGDVLVSTASGDVAIERTDGRMSASLASGDLRSEHVAHDLKLTTASGDIRIDRCDGTDINLKSVSGEIVLGIPSGTRVDADIHTLSGKIRLPEDRRTPEEQARRDPATDVEARIQDAMSRLRDREERLRERLTELSDRLGEKIDVPDVFEAPEPPDLPDPPQPPDVPFPPSRRRVRLVVRSVSGDIEILRA